MPSEIHPLETSYHRGIRYYDSGPISKSERPIILLHGLGNSLDFWTAIAPALAVKTRTVAIDIPGFGKSVMPADGFSLSSITREVRRLLDKLEVSSCILVAHSLGGFVGLHVASPDSTMVSRLVLVDAMLFTANDILHRPISAIGTPALSVNLGIQFAGGVLPIGRRTARLISATGLGRLTALWPFIHSPKDVNPRLVEIALSNNGGAAVLRTLCQARSVRLEDLMNKVDQPVDLLWGANDRLIRPEDVRKTRELLAVDRELAVPSCGHWPMIEWPDVVSDFILEALDNGE